MQLNRSENVKRLDGLMAKSLDRLWINSAALRINVLRGRSIESLAPDSLVDAFTPALKASEGRMFALVHPRFSLISDKKEPFMWSDLAWISNSDNGMFPKTIPSYRDYMKRVAEKIKEGLPLLVLADPDNYSELMGWLRHLSPSAPAAVVETLPFNPTPSCPGLSEILEDRQALGEYLKEVELEHDIFLAQWWEPLLHSLKRMNVRTFETGGEVLYWIGHFPQGCVPFADSMLLRLASSFINHELCWPNAQEADITELIEKYTSR